MHLSSEIAAERCCKTKMALSATFAELPHLGGMFVHL